jgi:hypothetical protein
MRWNPSAIILRSYPLPYEAARFTGTSHYTWLRVAGFEEIVQACKTAEIHHQHHSLIMDDDVSLNVSFIRPCLFPTGPQLICATFCLDNAGFCAK